ncbi:Erythrocyte carbonic anhydrase [Paragonimus heterotremus]|uniref:Carbonic anhydrase n=1 Tax=Paragonimus heterotremus TaxID=100268 RepID=A0A8J4WU86_9TREM|nr:Erythrocyte carbonic anhydrase [Paragonimus heterotremus]
MLLPVRLFPESEAAWSQQLYTVTNNGHSAKITFPSDIWFLSLTNDLTPQYEVVQIHFHWGFKNARGSEHLLQGKSFAMEAHLVCYNKRYKSFSEAAESPHGLAVLGFWVDISSASNTGITLLEQLGDFSKVLPDIVNYNTSVRINAFDLAELLTVVDPKNFFRYEGSLTTPPCTPNVIWTVFRDSALITEEQLALFRALQYSSQETAKQMGDNFRTALQLNPTNAPIPRVVYKTWSGSGAHSVNILLLLLTSGIGIYIPF